MTLRKKIFGSLFILGCAGVVTTVVLMLIGPKATSPIDMTIPQPPELPQFDLSLTELDRDILPDINLPESGNTVWGDISPDTDVSIDTSGISGFTPDSMPPFKFDITEFQELMKSIVSE